MKIIVSLLLIFHVSVRHAYSQDMIEYALPKEVETNLRNYLDEKLSNATKDEKYYCVLRNKEDKVVLSIQYYNQQSSDKTIKLIESSRRYILMGMHKLPVIFELDFMLVAHGRDDKGRPIRSRLIYENPYQIEFDQLGRIMKK